MDSKTGNQPHKLSLLSKPTKLFVLVIDDRDNTLPFRSKDLFLLFEKICSIFRASYYPSLLVEFSYLNYVVVNERINQLFSYFLLVEPLRLLDVFKAFSQLYTKNNRCTINLKDPLQTKNATMFRVKDVFFYMINGCKNTLSQVFSQNCFKSTLSVKKS